MDVLSETLAQVDPVQLKRELSEYVPVDVQKILAAAGIRDEHVFPTPLILQAKPTLVGYYRLLLGLPQKTFYKTGFGMSHFKRLENGGILRADQAARLPTFCHAMSEATADLVRQMSPTITPRDVAELPLLTIGSQFQGSNNNTIGKQATAAVYLSIVELVAPYTINRTDRTLSLKNASRRAVTITLASDPDVSIQEATGNSVHNKVAIEIKGGTDNSNAHNRAGEAEKSHLKARAAGFRDCWTVIAKKGVDFERLRAGSPTTTSWFDVAQVLARTGEDWDEFSQRLASAIGIPLPK